MSYAETFNELMELFTGVELVGAEIVKAGAHEGVDHYLTIKQGDITYTCIRKDDGTFTNWSKELGV